MRASRICWFALLSSGCFAQASTPADSGVRPQDAGSLVEAGEVIYRDAFSPMSKFACSTCHALEEPAEDGIRRPGFALGDATKRPTYKNALFTSMLDATNTCLVEWMVTDPWTEEDPRWKALFAFLDARASAGVAPVVEIQIVDVPADLTGGDATRGRVTLNETCANCHGVDSAGGEEFGGPPLKGAGLDAPYIARRVRKSGPTASPTYPGLMGNKGQMPFWGGNRLQDDELRDIIAFVLE